MISSIDKIEYMQYGYTHILRRIDPKTRNELGILLLSKSLQEARQDGYIGTTECVYELCDLMNEKKIERVYGTRSVTSNDQAT